MIRWNLGGFPPPPPGLLDELEDPAVVGVCRAAGELGYPTIRQSLTAMEGPDLLNL